MGCSSQIKIIAPREPSIREFKRSTMSTLTPDVLARVADSVREGSMTIQDWASRMHCDWRRLSREMRDEFGADWRTRLDL